MRFDPQRVAPSSGSRRAPEGIGSDPVRRPPSDRVAHTSAGDRAVRDCRCRRAEPLPVQRPTALSETCHRPRPARPC
jgi:hypothetical protein